MYAILKEWTEEKYGSSTPFLRVLFHDIQNLRIEKRSGSNPEDTRAPAKIKFIDWKSSVKNFVTFILLAR